MMIANIWEHWFTWYVSLADKDGKVLGTDHFETLDDAKAFANHLGAFIIMQ